MPADTKTTATTNGALLEAELPQPDAKESLQPEKESLPATIAATAAIVPPQTEAADSSESADAAPVDGVVIAEISAVAADGAVYLRLPVLEEATAGDLSEHSPVEAHSVLCPVERQHVGERAAVLFDRGQTSRPVVLGIVRADVRDRGEDSTDAIPRRVEIDASDEITLRCGQASLRLRADGDVVLRGQDVLHRASGTQRIRGSNVRIN